MRICFFGSGIYDALMGNIIGGAELQSSLLANALSRAGNEVIVIDTDLTVVVHDIGNIKIYKCDKGKIRIIRYFTNKLPSYFKLCYKINADIYYIRGRAHTQIVPLIVGKYLRRKIFIKGVSSDVDILPSMERIKKTFKYRKGTLNWIFHGMFTELFFSVIINHASILLLQHEKQDKGTINKKVKRYIFPNIFNTKMLEENQINNRRNSYLYVGTLSYKKGLLELKLIIESLPNLCFHLVGSPEIIDNRDFQGLISMKNVQYHGKLSREYIFNFMSSSIALINTSPDEGFPNTFLESWYCGCPVLSLNTDPGDVIVNKKLGLISNGKIDNMLKNISDLNDRQITFDPQALRNYVIKNHSFETAALKFNLIIENFKKLNK